MDVVLNKFNEHSVTVLVHTSSEVGAVNGMADTAFINAFSQVFVVWIRFWLQS